MLSRIAEALFWIGRYVERVDGTARLVDVVRLAMLEGGLADNDETVSMVVGVVMGEVETVDTYLELGGVLENCARQLYVHPNTVRYRLRRVAELTGRTPANARDALVLRVALSMGRLARARGLW